MKKGKYFPIFINLEGKRVLVFGGGNIALRRVQGLLSFGAVVTVCAPEIVSAIQELQTQYPDTLCLTESEYCPGFLAVDLVLSATNCPAIDLEIYTECQARRIPVNIASDQTKCDFFFPALAEWEELTVGISSGGQNPKKVRWLAQKIREYLGGLEWK